MKITPEEWLEHCYRTGMKGPIVWSPLEGVGPYTDDELDWNTIRVNLRAVISGSLRRLRLSWLPRSRRPVAIQRLHEWLALRPSRWGRSSCRAAAWRNPPDFRHPMATLCGPLSAA